METIRLILKNIFRHKLRASLTILGAAIAMLAFGLLRTLVGAWYQGVDASAADRLVTRSKISLIYFLPLAYRTKIMQVPGVAGIGHGVWYGGIYKDKKNFFPQFAISGTDYLDIYPELLLSDFERKAFEKEKKSAVVGRLLAERFGWKVGDTIPLQGTIFPGNLDFLIVGIYKGARKNVDETAFFFRWEYLNEHLRKNLPERADRVGWYMIKVKDSDRSAEVARDVDTLFNSSLAETHTESEKAFQMSFVAMTDAIIAAVKVISVVVIAIILIVLANTMAMTARERASEYAVLKTLGFSPWYVFCLVAAESVSISLIGGFLGDILMFPAGKLFHQQVESFLPVFEVTYTTLVLILLISFAVGLAAAIPPSIRMSRMSISDGLRHLG